LDKLTLRHAEKLYKKKLQVEALEALLETHLVMGTESAAGDYIKKLKARIHAARTQLSNMCGSRITKRSDIYEDKIKISVHS
jgi:hypothetical protein